ncbi:hypothetical protein ACIHCV_45720 [Streptomyces sp. NPDC051956]|uniref:hypothetical protein n=1 Tax=Streptomyces sp. NPDC051956 TaxID=3365677 RepID=UPI0037D87D7B
MPRSRTVRRRLTPVAGTALCGAALSVTQAAPAHATTQTVSFTYQHLWLTPEISTRVRGAISFIVQKCDHPNQKMTVLLRRTDGFNYDIGSRTIYCRAGQRAAFADQPKGTFEFELGKLDDGKVFKGTGTSSFT